MNGLMMEATGKRSLNTLVRLVGLGKKRKMVRLGNLWAGCVLVGKTPIIGSVSPARSHTKSWEWTPENGIELVKPSRSRPPARAVTPVNPWA